LKKAIHIVIVEYILFYLKININYYLKTITFNQAKIFESQFILFLQSI